MHRRNMCVGRRRALEQQVARVERSEIRERSRRVNADPGFHFVQSGLRLLLQGRNDLVGIEPKDFRERHEFHDGDAPLSTFEAGDEGLRFP